MNIHINNFITVPNLWWGRIETSTFRFPTKNNRPTTTTTTIMLRRCFVATFMNQEATASLHAVPFPSSFLFLKKSLLPFFPSSLLPFFPSSLLPFFPSSLLPFFPSSFFFLPFTYLLLDSKQMGCPPCFE